MGAAEHDEQALGHTEQGQAGVEAFVRDPRSALVAVDFDGVMSPIVPDPEQAFALPEATAALGRMGTLIGTVAVVTGRPVRSAVRLGKFGEAAGLDGLIILGQYGVERWDAATDEFSIPDAPPEITALKDELPGVLAEIGYPDLYLEDKGRALGVHTRRASNPAQALADIKDPVFALADRHGLHVEPGKNVLEIRASGMDKGQALTALVAERNARAVAYAGDDLGDVPAFEAVQKLRDDGLAGLLIASTSDEQDALTERADVLCDGPAGVARYLQRLADRIEAGDDPKAAGAGS